MHEIQQLLPSNKEDHEECKNLTDGLHPISSKTSIGMTNIKKRLPKLAIIKTGVEIQQKRIL